jgi:pilus assembly protein Flp/PilA
MRINLFGYNRRNEFSIFDAHCFAKQTERPTSLRSFVEDFTMRMFSRFLKDESGATAIEYGLIAGLIGVVVITAVTSVGTKVSNQFKTIGNALK